jgi:hypothetical protein
MAATKIRCYTLFDITQTGITNRRNNAPHTKTSQWEKDRNTQCNLDTIIQVISLRSQPENITTPEAGIIIFDETNNFGFLFEQDEEAHSYWSFDFMVNYQGVYNDGIDEFGHLYNDCNGVPMLKVGSEWKKLPDFLDSSPELRNIYFEVIPYEEDKEEN